jgi:hypothetical protein
MNETWFQNYSFVILGLLEFSPADVNDETVIYRSRGVHFGFV